MTQVEALGYKIDIVVHDRSGNRLAVECDGDRWHSSDTQIRNDLYRQRTLETIGWRFLSLPCIGVVRRSGETSERNYCRVDAGRFHASSTVGRHRWLQLAGIKFLGARTAQREHQR